MSNGLNSSIGYYSSERYEIREIRWDIYAGEIALIYDSKTDKIIKRTVRKNNTVKINGETIYVK